MRPHLSRAFSDPPFAPHATIRYREAISVDDATIAALRAARAVSIEINTTITIASPRRQKTCQHHAQEKTNPGMIPSGSRTTKPTWVSFRAQGLGFFKLRGQR
jgi:hypothetical protein